MTTKDDLLNELESLWEPEGATMIAVIDEVKNALKDRLSRDRLILLVEFFENKKEEK